MTEKVESLRTAASVVGMRGQGVVEPRAQLDSPLERAVDVEMAAAPGGFALAGATHAPLGIRSGIRDAGPVALAGFASNGANVLVTILVARLLETRGYGALAQLTSLFLIVSMPGTAVVVGVVRSVTSMSAFGRSGSVRRWARLLEGRVLTGVALFTAIVLLARGPIARLLSIPSPLGVFAVLAAAAVWVSLSVDRGLLQAKRAYGTLATNLLVEGGVRTAAVLTLVGAGLGVTGAAWGILAAELVTAVHARVCARRVWTDAAAPATPTSHEVPAGGTVETVDELRNGEARGARFVAGRSRLLLDVGGSLVAMALLAYLQNVDVIVLGRENPHASGPYAAISVASKALVFGAFALGGYLLPEAAIAWHRGGHALRQLGVTLLFLAVPGAVLLTGAAVFPRSLLSLVFSSRYAGAESAFWLLVVAMALLSVTVVLTTYMLAAGQRWIGLLLGLGAVVATAAVAAAHGSPRSTAEAELAVQAGLAIATTAAFAVVHSRRTALVGQMAA